MFSLRYHIRSLFNFDIPKYNINDDASYDQKHGAELRHLTAEPIQTERTKVVYLVRAQLDLMKFICSHIHNDTSKGLHREYYLYFVPRRMVACEKVQQHNV